MVSEPYRQWVIEDSFCNGRPAWELAGAQFTTEVPLFEAVKLRLLNGSHFALAYLSALRGFEFVHDAMADDRMRRYLRAYMDEVSPSVPVPSGMDIPQYKATLIHRFSNPALCDQIGRICAQGSSKISKFLLPSLEDLLVSKLPTRFLALALASWLQYMKGRDEQGRPLHIQDAALTETQRLLQSDNLSGRPCFGSSLVRSSRWIVSLRSSFGTRCVAWIAREWCPPSIGACADRKRRSFSADIPPVAPPGQPDLVLWQSGIEDVRPASIPATIWPTDVPMP